MLLFYMDFVNDSFTWEPLATAFIKSIPNSNVVQEWCQRAWLHSNLPTHAWNPLVWFEAQNLVPESYLASLWVQGHVGKCWLVQWPEKSGKRVSFCSSKSQVVSLSVKSVESSQHHRASSELETISNCTLGQLAPRRGWKRKARGLLCLLSGHLHEALCAMSCPCLIWTREIWCRQLNFRQPKTESTTKTCISVLWASSLAFLSASDVLSASEWLDWCLLRSNMHSQPRRCKSRLLPSILLLCAMCLLLGNHLSLATAPPQKPRNPHSRWKRFHLGFSLVGKVRWHLASGKRTGCAGQEFFPPNLLHLTSLHATRKQQQQLTKPLHISISPSKILSILTLKHISKGEGLRQPVWQVLVKRIFSWNNCVFTQSERV